MIKATREPGFFSVLCVKVPGTPDPAARFWRRFFIVAMALEAARMGGFLVKGGAPDVGTFDILLGLALTAGLGGFLMTHTAWSQPWPEKGRFRFDSSGVAFSREHRTDNHAPDWTLTWADIRQIRFLNDSRGLVIRLETAGGNSGDGFREIPADLVRFENCPDDVKTATAPDSLPGAIGSRLIVRAIARYAPQELLQNAIS